MDWIVIVFIFVIGFLFGGYYVDKKVEKEKYLMRKAFLKVVMR